MPFGDEVTIDIKFKEESKEVAASSCVQQEVATSCNPALEHRGVVEQAASIPVVSVSNAEVEPSAIGAPQAAAVSWELLGDKSGGNSDPSLSNVEQPQDWKKSWSPITDNP